MKVVCIDNKLRKTGVSVEDRLTVGKVYECFSEDDERYFIYDNTTKRTGYRKDRFISLDAQRQNIINQILK